MLGLQFVTFTLAIGLLLFLVWLSAKRSTDVKEYSKNKPKSVKETPSHLPKGAPPKRKKHKYPAFRFRNSSELNTGRKKFFAIRKKDCEAAARIKCPMKRHSAFKSISQNTFRYSVNLNY